MNLHTKGPSSFTHIYAPITEAFYHFFPILNRFSAVVGAYMDT